MILLFIMTHYFFLKNMHIVKTLGLPRSRIFRIFVFIMTASFLFSFITERCSRWITAIWIEGRSLAEISECTEEPFPERVKNGLAKSVKRRFKVLQLPLLYLYYCYDRSAIHQTWDKRNSDMNWDVDSDENVRLTSNDVGLNRLG